MQKFSHYLTFSIYPLVMFFVSCETEDTSKPAPVVVQLFPYEDRTPTSDPDDILKVSVEFEPYYKRICEAENKFIHEHEEDECHCGDEIFYIKLGRIPEKQQQLLVRKLASQYGYNSIYWYHGYSKNDPSWLIDFLNPKINHTKRGNYVRKKFAIPMINSVGKEYTSNLTPEDFFKLTSLYEEIIGIKPTQTYPQIDVARLKSRLNDFKSNKYIGEKIIRLNCKNKKVREELLSDSDITN